MNYRLSTYENLLRLGYIPIRGIGIVGSTYCRTLKPRGIKFPRNHVTLRKSMYIKVQRATPEPHKHKNCHILDLPGGCVSHPPFTPNTFLYTHFL